MAWVRIDDGFDEHPKIASLDERAAAVFVFGLCYCNRNLTDGFIPAGYGRRVDRRAVKALVVARLWIPCDGGWQVHDYLDYQPSKEEVEEERARQHLAKQAAGRAGGLAKAVARKLAETKQKASSELAEGVAETKQEPSKSVAPYPSRTHTHPNPSLPTAGAASSPGGAGGILPPGRLPAEVLDRLRMPPIGVNGSSGD